MNFNCIGYDIRYNNPIQLSADSLVWERDEDFYYKLIQDFGFVENAWQLLNLSKDDFFRLKSKLIKRPELCLVALCVPSDIYEWCVKTDDCLKKLYTDYSVSQFDYDVCDIDGFYSFFDMQKEIAKQQFDVMNWQEKLALTTLANQTIPEHSPFYIIKVELIF